MNSVSRPPEFFLNPGIIKLVQALYFSSLQGSNAHAIANRTPHRSPGTIVSSPHLIQDGALLSCVCLTWKHLLDMPNLTTLLAVLALCLRDTVAFNVVLEPLNTALRSRWGDNDIQLTCTTNTHLQSQVLEPIPFSAVFTKDQTPITVSEDDNCIPIGDQYCYTNGGERLSFTANSVTEGKYACEYYGQTSNELAIVAYPDEVPNEANQTGEWGKKLVLPCRFTPGPIGNDFYHHTWISILNGGYKPVSPNDNIHDNNTDFSLTFVKLNPILAEYNYQCGIDFLDNDPSQPYYLRTSSNDLENAIDVIISEIEGPVSIERGPSNAVVSANESAVFSCALNVTGNEVLQFKAFGSIFHDRCSECEIDTTSRSRCWWPNVGINMTCDYSVAYQIICNLTLSGLTEANSTRVICFSEMGEDAPMGEELSAIGEEFSGMGAEFSGMGEDAPALSATGALAVRIGNVPTPTIGKVKDSNNLAIAFDLPAVPFIPLEVQTVFFRGSDQVGIVDHIVSSESKAVKISISNSNVPEGLISARIRVKFLGDDNQPFSDLSDESNSLVINEEG